VPHKFVDEVLDELTPLLKPGDTIIEGGNSPFRKSMQRAKKLEKKGINFLDVGVSGGPGGARNGACMMVGGKKSHYNKLKPLLKDLCVNNGYGYMGKAGAGHFVKMVHNGIEYGMMQSIAEGFDLMSRSNDFNLDLKEIARVYNRGSVIESRLIGWLVSGFKKFGASLKGVSGGASATGEGEWTSQFAHQLGVTDKVIHESVRARTRSKKKPSFQGKIIMAMRNQFGGHDPNPKRK